MTDGDEPEHLHGCDPFDEEQGCMLDCPVAKAVALVREPCRPGAWGSATSCAAHEGLPIDQTTGWCEEGRPHRAGDVVFKGKDGAILEDPAGHVVMVELDETGWLGTSDAVERARRLEACRAFLRELTTLAIEVRSRRDGDRPIEGAPPERVSTISIAPSMRYLYRHAPERGVQEIATIEVFWQDGPALRATAPTFEVDLGHTVERMRGDTWTIRRCSS